MKEYALDMISLQRYLRRHKITYSDLSPEEIERFRSYRIPEREINVVRDESAGVWVATTRDIPGLELESESLDAIANRIAEAVADLDECSGASSEFKNIILRVYIADKH